ncbi:dihydroorotate dehydrogenase domain-containing protein [Sarocladium implicatum]|nr:dihydroorotate dehydrogenase domain-containing protein [Sarocladium implicatum]
MSASRTCCRLATSGIRPAGQRPSTILSSRSTSHFSRRTASSSAGQGAAAAAGRLGVVVYGSALAATVYVAYLYATDTRAFIHKAIVPPALRLIFPDAEEAHHSGTSMLKLLHSLNLHPRERGESLKDTGLATEVYGTTISNPVGISAGLDKDGELPDVLFALGAGLVEVGGCTPRPQSGNPKPRVFRVPSLDGMINRYGLNSRGADDMAIRLRDRLRRYALSIGLTETQVLNGEANVPPGSLQPGRLLAVQIAKNKETTGEQAVIDDHIYCVKRLAPYADVLVVNVSSPNTPGLRDLQATEPLTRLLSAVVKEASKTGRQQPPKVMVKVSPDEDEETQMDGIVQAVHISGVDGVIVGNTTKRRQGLNPKGVRLPVKEQKAMTEEGGYSGPAMFSRTLDLVSRYRTMLDAESKAKGIQQKTIFATGGITNGEQALKVLNAGASVAMVYTGMVYGGAGTVTRIKREMIEEANSK